MLRKITQGRFWLVAVTCRRYIETMNEWASTDNLDRNLNPQVCRRARLARDPRFDGEFFLAVKTTGIYCRPVCPARPPKESNVSYYRSAAEAAALGFRPCLRCRPESAPGSPAWRGTDTTVDRALTLIREGALNTGTVAELAQRLGVGERYLRKLFAARLGVSPLAVGQNQRLLFARKLLFETDMSVTDLALAAGFSSIRRFNSAMREHFACSPSDLRRQQSPASATAAITLHLTYRPPYDWDAVADFFGRHAIAGLEQVDANGYWRRIQWQDQIGEIRVRPGPRNSLALTVNLADHRHLMSLVARVRQMFDLDANPALIAEVLGRDPFLSPVLLQHPGVRSPRVMSPWESALRAVVGQQVSIAAARRVCERLARSCAGDSTLLFPDAAQLLRLSDEELPMPRSRKATLRGLCQAMIANAGLPDIGQLGSLRGIGPWTCNLVAMRGLGQPDAFPIGDLGLERAWEALGGDPALLNVRADQWRPWGSYAANLLWRTLSK